MAPHVGNNNNNTSSSNNHNSHNNNNGIDTTESHDQSMPSPPVPPTQKRPPQQIVWRNVAIFVYLHIAALAGLVMVPYASWKTIVWSTVLYGLAAMGVTAGVHRLWSHRSYKAKLPLRVFLMLCNCISFQNSILEWSRDHRVHHKFSETDADPHNAKRGFFFSHMGWLLVRKHPDVKTKGKTVDVSDVAMDPVVAFQERHFKSLSLLLNVVVPTLVPVYFWAESTLVAFLVAFTLRYMLVLNATWLVNSAAHMWGQRPYDESINPAENMFVSLFATGEGFHNFHHTFPQDYSTSEFGWKLNPTAMFIDCMAAIGQAYDRKTVGRDVVTKRRQRTGDLRDEVIADRKKQ